MLTPKEEQNSSQKPSFWTQEDLMKHHKDMTARGLDILEKKNTDYKAGSGDAFANFRSAVFLNLRPEKGILLRIQDKMARLTSFLDRDELSVNDESAQDSCLDAMNYLIILSGMLEERKQKLQRHAQQADLSTERKEAE